MLLHEGREAFSPAVARVNVQAGEARWPQVDAPAGRRECPGPLVLDCPGAQRLCNVTPFARGVLADTATPGGRLVALVRAAFLAFPAGEVAAATGRAVGAANHRPERERRPAELVVLEEH